MSTKDDKLEYFHMFNLNCCKENLMIRDVLKLHVTSSCGHSSSLVYPFLTNKKKHTHREGSFGQIIVWLKGGTD